MVLNFFAGKKKIKTRTKNWPPARTCSRTQTNPKTHFTHVLVLHFLRIFFKFPIEKNINFFTKKFPNSALEIIVFFTRSLRSGMTNYVIS